MGGFSDRTIDRLSSMNARISASNSPIDFGSFAWRLALLPWKFASSLRPAWAR